MMRPAALALLLAAALGAAPGCARRETPDGAYRALVEAVRARDGDRAWGLLAPSTRAWLDARARVAAASAPGVVPAGGKELVLGSAALAVRPPRQILVLRESADRALLQVTADDGAVQDVTVVRDGGWRVELPEP